MLIDAQVLDVSTHERFNPDKEHAIFRVNTLAQRLDKHMQANLLIVSLRLPEVAIGSLLVHSAVLRTQDLSFPRRHCKIKEMKNAKKWKKKVKEIERMEEIIERKSIDVHPRLMHVFNACISNLRCLL